MFPRLNLYVLRLLLTFTIPSMATPIIPESGSAGFPASLAYPAFSYDDVLDFLDAIEDHGFDERYSSDQLEKVAVFLSVLARNGIAPSDPISNALLNQDIDSLLCDASSYRCLFNDRSELYSIELAISHGDRNPLLCKSWVSRQCHSLKKFVTKHKTAMIIGAAVVVAATVAVIAVAAISSASAAAAGAGAVATGLASNDQADRPSPSSVLSPMEDSLPSIETMQFENIMQSAASTPLAQIFEHQATPIKEMLAQEALMESPVPIPGKPSFTDKARQAGSYLAHKILDETTSFASVIPQVLEEIGNIGRQVLPGNIALTDFDGNPLDPVGNFHENVLTLHERIDDVFATSFAQSFMPESKESLPDFVLGVIPLPGLSGELFFDLKKFSNAGKAYDRAGFTRAGRGLQKHADRMPTVFPKAYGNPTQINEQGQAVLDKILNHPEKTIILKNNKTYGRFIDIAVPNLGGARFSADGKKFIGFLEP